MNRNEADIRYTWDLRSLFASQEAFDAQLDTSKAQLQALCARKGHISDTIDTYIAFLNDQETFERGLEDLVVYARMCTDVEPKDMQNQQNLAAANIDVACCVNLPSSSTRYWYSVRTPSAPI